MIWLIALALLGGIVLGALLLWAAVSWAFEKFIGDFFGR